MAKEVMLTTVDNPFDPFTDFENWYRFDEDKGYHSCEYVARIANASQNLSDADYDEEVERAIDEIVKYNVLGIYKKAERVY